MLRAAISRLARRPALVALLLFLTGFAFTALPSLRYGPPLPALHDEHANLFLGETFARGRLTNSPPPGPPEFYQTFHEFITPRYESKFPPGQGIALAVGIWLGNPIIGIWLVNGLWAAALFWMLRGATGPGWAFGGALTGVIGYGAMSYWGYSYWGGSTLALAGALAFGGALRLWRKRGNPIIAAAGTGLGCALMALTRPLDGFIFALLPAGLVAWRLAKWKTENGKWKNRSTIALAATIPALAGVALLLGYNLATTGSAFTFAHRLYDQTYLPRMALFVWEKPGPDPPNEPAFFASYENAFSANMSADPLPATLYWSNLRRYAAAQFGFLFPLWLWPLVAASAVDCLIRSRRAQQACAPTPSARRGAGLLRPIPFAHRNGTALIALLSLFFIAIPLFTLRFYGFSHYIAAWTAPALLLIIQGARQIFILKRHLDNSLRWLGCAGIFFLIAWPVASFTRELTRGAPQWLSYAWVLDQEQVREDLADLAQKTGRKQLALVVYPPNHDPHAEWIYNSPDPGAQDVLWLRALGPARVPELAKIFPGYDEWLIYVKADGHFDHRVQIQLPSAPNPVSSL